MAVSSRKILSLNKQLRAISSFSARAVPAGQAGPQRRHRGHIAPPIRLPSNPFDFTSRKHDH
jgi:hypothetical protein